MSRRREMRAIVSLTAVGALFASVGFRPSQAEGSHFNESVFWATFDPGANGVGTDPDGFYGAVFDGRYVYFVPYNNGTARYGEVLRCDTTGAFDAATSWVTYDPGANGVGVDPDGYIGAVFDGRYVYFAPHHNGSAYHGEVLRYDTTAAFSAAASWVTYDPGANGVGTDPDGFAGAVFDGRYVYFVPTFNGTDYHGEVLRYDTTGAFASASSWTTFDAGANGVGNDPDGYNFGAFDGRYIYFAPNYNGPGFHGEVLRYDTAGAFTAAAAWSTYDPGANGVGTNPNASSGAVFDGRFVYFIPYGNATEEHGEVLRYDTTGAFNVAASWVTYDYGADPLGCSQNPDCTDPDGYVGAVFDGRYVYFVPSDNGTTYSGEVLRYDTTGAFSAASSWATYDPGANGVGTDPDGYAGGAFDGRYVYFVPYNNGSGQHGEVLRYDTGAKIPTMSQWGMMAMAALMLSAGGVVIKRRQKALGTGH